MRRHDVLVFSSLFEGFGLVVTEALSQGLPVITTPHTCGPDILEDGVDGFIVPIRNPEAIAEKLEHLASDRSLLAEMSQAALKKARILSWAEYRRRIVEVVSTTSRVLTNGADRGTGVSPV
jgi:glycosyltransferase involved in cell wall biosynthesis